MHPWRHVGLALLIGVLLLGLMASAPGQAAGEPAIDEAGGPEDQITVTLRADSAPAPGQAATLTLEATPSMDAPNLTLHWFVPEGVELLGGEAEDSIGAVGAGETIQRQREVRFAEAGTYKIAVDARYSPHESLRYGATGVLFFVVDADAPRVSDMDPDAGRDMHDPIGVSNVQVEPLDAVPQATADDPCFRVSGSLTRIDKPVTTSGYGADVRVPVTDYYVQLREADPVFDDSYGGAVTDENGNFEFDTFCDDDGLFDDTLEFYVYLEASSAAAKVIDSSWLDEVYKYKSSEVSSDGGSLSFNLALNETQSAVFNILNAADDAQEFWLESAAGLDIPGQVEIHWEPGYGDDGSYFVAFWDEITIADDPSDPDEWDDSVIIHEWGHFADDKLGCDDNPGGSHTFSGTFDEELAFGEGYPDYYQSVVREWRGDGAANWYLDVSGSGNPFGADLEAVSGLATSGGSFSIPQSVRNEVAIAGALWDLHDAVNDGQDTVNHGHAAVQDIYTDEDFVNQNFFDDDCDFANYVRTWVDAGQPADAATAAAVNQNTGNSSFPGTMRTQTVSSQQSKSAAAATQISSRDYRWWNRVSFVVDKSSSMSGDKLDAVKSVMTEQVNDYSDVSEGTEFDLRTFHAGSSELQTEFAGLFFSDMITPALDGLNADGSDAGCEVDALDAVAQAVEGEFNSDVWLYTDGDAPSGGVEATSQRLTDKSSRASFVLLGGCSTTTSTQTAEDEETVRQQQALRDAASAMLGSASLDEAPAGIVPYLLTATKTGGQFLYVDENQLSDAADVLRAQLTHSAGAGKWSDYVSEKATYRWDTLAPWEYNWMDMSSVNEEELPSSNGYTTVTIPGGGFRFYDIPYAQLRLFEDGYVSMPNNSHADPDNEPIPNSDAPNAAIYAFWDDLARDTAGDADLVTYSKIYTKLVGDWFGIEYYDFAIEPEYWGAPDPNLTFQIQLNGTTNEIRLLYDEIPDGGAQSATIGIESHKPIGEDTTAVQVSYNDAAGATEGEGYKFTPVPPQPTKDYTVTVDGTMESVGFLLTGYSGSFDPLVVKYPNGDPVDCNNTVDVLCLRDIDPDDRLVQYVQVDVNGRTGDWTATVTPGPSGSGTFSFTSMAASPISPESVGDRTRSTGDSMDVLVDLGQPASGNTMTGYFRTTDGEPFGSSFTLYDDGSHGDGKAGDGVFGASGFTPPDAGSAHLWMEGTVEGTAFVRSDPVPYTFHPVQFASQGDAVNTGGTTQLKFDLRNDDTADHCYYFDITVPEGWWYDVWDRFPRCVGAGESVVHTVDVRMSDTSTNSLPSGTSGVVSVAAIEWEKEQMTNSASAQVTRRRPPAAIDIFNPSKYLRPGGDTTPLRFYVYDSQSMPVADGTELTLSASMGSLPATTTVYNGVAEVTFASGSQEGTATITAETSNDVSATTTVDVLSPLPNGITLDVSPATLPPDQNNAILTATVTDPWGDPVAGETVRIGVEGDGQDGTIDGDEVFTGTTDANGQVTATFTRVAATGDAGVRAELLRAGDMVHSDRAVITLGSHDTYLPIILR